MKKNVLLTGASGTVGIEVLQQLIEKNEVNLTVFDIRTSKSEKNFAPYLDKAEIVYGDITNPEDVEKVSYHKDVVIHLAAIIQPLAGEKPKLAYNVNVIGTKNLITAIKKNSPKAFFMYSSSVAIYGDCVANPNIRVTDPLKPSVGDNYAETKLEAENLIQASDLNWTIFRLAAIMKNHKISKLMFHMPLETTMEICTPEDTARAFVNGIEKQHQLENRIFNLGGGKECTTTFKDFLQRSFNLYGLGKLNFPKHTFAKYNFHCGYYVDGMELEEILHFRRDDLEDYFRKTKESISVFTKISATIFRFPIKKYLQSISEPLKAVKEINMPLIKRYFGDKIALED